MTANIFCPLSLEIRGNDTSTQHYNELNLPISSDANSNIYLWNDQPSQQNIKLQTIDNYGRWQKIQTNVSFSIIHLNLEIKINNMISPTSHKRTIKRLKITKIGYSIP